MTAVVTGGSGFVGGAVIRRLVADGAEVVAAVRSHRAAEVVASLGARPAHVDLGDADAVARVFDGAETVFHVAGANTMCPRRPADLHRTNVDLAVGVIHAAAKAGVGRVVHTSSAATIGEAAGEIGREDSVHRGSFLSPYERSKYLGERAVLGVARDRGVDVVVVNPCSVQGPGRRSGTAKLFFAIARTETAFLVRTWVSVIDVDDCAEGHVRAAHHGVRGERYLLCGASLTVEDAVNRVRDRTGRPRRIVWVPPAIVRAAAPLTRAAGLRHRDRDPSICPAVVRALLHGHRYDGSRAVAELGASYRPFDESLDRTLAWARAEGILESNAGG